MSTIDDRLYFCWELKRDMVALGMAAYGDGLPLDTMTDEELLALRKRADDEAQRRYRSR